eukprot:scaffold44740_cov221-Amphora_coffeaeformis.AAC.1
MSCTRWVGCFPHENFFAEAWKGRKQRWMDADCGKKVSTCTLSTKERDDVVESEGNVAQRSAR